MDLEKEIQRFLISFPHGSVEADRLYESLLRLAAADHRIRPGEREFLDRVTIGPAVRGRNRFDVDRVGVMWRDQRDDELRDAARCSALNTALVSVMAATAAVGMVTMATMPPA
jgi:hypothetical protein